MTKFRDQKTIKNLLFTFSAGKIITINLFYSTLLGKLGFTTKTHADEIV